MQWNRVFISFLFKTINLTNTTGNVGLVQKILKGNKSLASFADSFGSYFF
jgi:hypothetical protein